MDAGIVIHPHAEHQFSGLSAPFVEFFIAVERARGSRRGLFAEKPSPEAAAARRARTRIPIACCGAVAPDRRRRNAGLFQVARRGIGRAFGIEHSNDMLSHTITSPANSSDLLTKGAASLRVASRFRRRRRRLGRIQLESLPIPIARKVKSQVDVFLCCDLAPVGNQRTHSARLPCRTRDFCRGWRVIDSARSERLKRHAEERLAAPHGVRRRPYPIRRGSRQPLSLNCCHQRWGGNRQRGSNRSDRSAGIEIRTEAAY